MGKAKLKRERWKGKYIWVIRDEKGQVVSKTLVKDSGIRTKAQAAKKFASTGTLNPKIFQRTRLPSSNLIVSKTPVTAKKRTQLTAKFEVIKNGKRTGVIVQGYSRLLSRTKDPIKSAKNSAFRKAEDLGVVKYGDKRFKLLEISRNYKGFVPVKAKV